MPLHKPFIYAGALLACAAALTACKSTTSSGPGTDPAPPGTAPSASSSAPAAGGTGSTPTGTQLKTLMPTAAKLPKGWKLGGSSTAFDTGAKVKSPGDPLLPGKDCAQAMTNGGAKTLTSDYEASYAEQGLKSPNDTASDLIFNGYQPGDAVKQMAEVSALVKRCASFSTHDINGKIVRMASTSSAIAGLGEQALDVKVTPTGAYVASEIILVRSGDVIMAVDANSQSGPMPALRPLAKSLAEVLPLKS
ncbi:hypothetical protein [Actinomadura coerulea]|uniref:hypothetical protein n=1 Tax=Actinomadura coerulea TaxID=46159 RepID=UPI00344199F7